MNEVGVTIARWEGVVESIDEAARTMIVTLRSKGGIEPEHTAELMLSEVGEDDQDLVEPGAVFYIEQTRRHVRKTMALNQTLSFRRLPAWSKRTIEMNEEKGAVIRSRFKQPTYGAE